MGQRVTQTTPDNNIDDFQHGLARKPVDSIASWLIEIAGKTTIDADL